MKSANSEDLGLILAGGEIPAAMSSLIDGAVAAFDADRITSRRYLMRASALLHATCPRKNSRCALPRGALASWQVNRVIDHIETHLAERITGQDLADLVHVSIGQLFRGFKVSVGAPPFHYIALRRFDLACTLMKTTHEPLSQIAAACGLCDQSHLCSMFRRMTGMSPAAWRRAHVSIPRAEPAPAPARKREDLPPEGVEPLPDDAERPCGASVGLSMLNHRAAN